MFYYRRQSTFAKHRMSKVMNSLESHSPRDSLVASSETKTQKMERKNSLKGKRRKGCEKKHFSANIPIIFKIVRALKLFLVVPQDDELGIFFLPVCTPRRFLLFILSNRRSMYNLFHQFWPGTDSAIQIFESFSPHSYFKASINLIRLLDVNKNYSTPSQNSSTEPQSSSQNPKFTTQNHTIPQAPQHLKN